MKPCRAESATVYFGGGNRKPGILRDLLQDHVEKIPPGGSIDWVTYYFRDRRLAEALVRARERGVKVRVTLDGRPRTKFANDAVISILQGRDGIGNGFRKSMPLGRFFRLHTKLYCFSHPIPHVLVGSFNPSGDLPEEHPEILKEIGDQYRGFNFLVSIREPYLVKRLVEHARWINKRDARPWLPCAIHQNRIFDSGNTKLFFLPSIRQFPVRQLFKHMDQRAQCRIAASHIKGKYAVDILLELAARGCSIEILAEATERRVPSEIEAMLKSADVKLRRIGLKNGLPMHDKFMLLSLEDKKWVVFGSFNWNSKSLRFNQEIGVISSDPGLYDVFNKRWQELQHSL